MNSFCIKITHKTLLGLFFVIFLSHFEIICNFAPVVCVIQLINRHLIFLLYNQLMNL